MTVKAWRSSELKTLRTMAASGCTAAQIAAALPGRSKDGVRGRAVAFGISLRQARANARKVLLTPDISLRLKLASQARGDISPTELARQLLAAVLLQQHRDLAVSTTLAAGAAAAAGAAKSKKMLDLNPPPAPNIAATLRSCSRPPQVAAWRSAIC
jgi:hypothetical protein